MFDIQSTINELTEKNDRRISVFEIEIQGLKNSTLTLSGRVLHETQLEELRRLLPLLKLNLNAVQVLSHGPAERVHVGTNLTGLYEKPTFGMPLSSELAYGTELEVLEVQNRWVFTRQQDGYLGWAYRPYLREGPAPGRTHLVIVPAGEVYSEPTFACEVVTRLVSGTGVRVEENINGWSRITANRPGWIPSTHLRALANLPHSLEDRRLTLMEDSKRLLGVPYLWGGISGNGIDCSGFVRLLHGCIGIDIPRDADMQHMAAYPVEPPYQPGDLFFFNDGEGGRRITHVGMSLGGWSLIHSSRRNNGIYIDDLQEQESLKSTFVSAGSFLREI